jgi:3',5'-cyclic AMP phosphodiesterase CpdA
MRWATVLVLLVALAGCGADERPSSSQSTVQRTLVDSDGDGFLEPGPGEPLGGTRVPGGRALATFGQLSDTHVRDEESPARVPFLDRIGPPVSSTFRPQEAFSTQVLCAAVRALNREHPQAVVVTGDIVDSAQENELGQALAVLDGGVVTPDSGEPGYDGVQAASNPDPFYFRPDNDAPRHPGVLDVAQRPFRAEGLRAPWFPAIGNHDVLVQGEVPATPEIERIATGDQMVVGIDPEFVPPLDEGSAPAAVNALLTQGDVFGRSESVPADPRRRHLEPREVVARLAAAAGVRRDAPSGGAGRLDYVFDISADVRGIVLDTVDRTGGSDGVLTAAQLAWLRRELAAARDHWIVVFAHNALPEPALALLDRTPRVVAVVRGNSHRNAIAPRDGFWLISTSSLADFPQQARMFRLREAPGGAVLETWMVDHDGRGLAGVARELAYLDAQGGRPQGFAGRSTDRNMRLFVQP